MNKAEQMLELFPSLHDLERSLEEYTYAKTQKADKGNTHFVFDDGSELVVHHEDWS